MAAPDPAHSAENVRPKKGDLWIANPENRPVERVYVEVTRVAKDGAWVDIRCFTWACSWAKRMTSWPPLWAIEASWGTIDLTEQEWDYDRKREGVGPALSLDGDATR